MSKKIPCGVIGIFHCHKPPDRTMALGSTQPLAEMSTRRISWGKCGRCVRLKTLPPSCAFVMKSGNLNFLEPSGPLQACNGTALPFNNLQHVWKVQRWRSYSSSGLYNIYKKSYPRKSVLHFLRRRSVYWSGFTDLVFVAVSKEKEDI